MKTFIYAGFFAFLISGCCSYTEVATKMNDRLIDDDAESVGEVYVANISYRWFGVIPWCTGKTWQQGAYEKDGVVSGIHWFADEATLDEQLRGLKHAMDEFGAAKVTNLRTTISDDRLWSLFFMSRRVIKTRATMIK